MTFRSRRTTGPLLALALAFLTASAASAPAWAQEKKIAQKNGVDISKMGAYRALAQHKAEEYGGDTALAKTNRKLFEEIDKAMDQFITPITESKGKTPDPAKVKAAFNTYMEQLKLAD
jgi:hypothetical protein